MRAVNAIHGLVVADGGTILTAEKCLRNRYMWSDVRYEDGEYGWELLDYDNPEADTGDNGVRDALGVCHVAPSSTTGKWLVDMTSPVQARIEADDEASARKKAEALVLFSGEY